MGIKEKKIKRDESLKKNKKMCGKNIAQIKKKIKKDGI